MKKQTDLLEKLKHFTPPTLEDYMKQYPNGVKDIVVEGNKLLSRMWWTLATPDDVKEEIASGADINARDQNGLTPLMYATYNKDKPELMITELLNNGANPQLTDNRGHNASDYISNCLNLSGEQKVLLSLKCAKYNR